jgi:addiction module HigA family antidote
MSLERRGEAGWAVHPGEILKEEFLRPLKLTNYRLAKNISVTPQRISDIVLKKHGISADIAVRLSRFFGTTPEFWMNLQAAYELSLARKELRGIVNKIVPMGMNSAA